MIQVAGDIDKLNICVVRIRDTDVIYLSVSIILLLGTVEAGR